MANQWFRMYHEFATDPKVQMLSEVDQRRYVMLLCLRCSNNDVTLHETEVAFQLRVTETEWADTKQKLLEKKLIDSDNKPTAWDKRQYVSDSSAARVRKHREKKKQACNVTVTPPDTDTDTDTDIYIKKKKKFTPPTIDEIFEYIGDKSEAEKFYHFYNSKDWMVGKNKMKVWKSAASNWMNNSNNLKPKLQAVVNWE